MIESEFWSHRMRPLIKRGCQVHGFHSQLTRVENAVADGMPDVEYCITRQPRSPGVAGWIELKYTQSHPKRESTPLLGRGNGLRRSQITWAFKRSYVGGRVWALFGSPEAAYLIDLRGLSLPQLGGLELLTPAGLREISAWHGFHDKGGTLPLALLDEGPKT